MRQKKTLKTCIAGQIEAYIHLMRDKLGRNFKIERSLLFAFDNFCFDNGCKNPLTQANIMDFCLSGDIMMIQRAKRYRILYKFYDYCRVYDESLPPIAIQPIEATYHRFKPYIYTDDDVKKLLLAARGMKGWSNAMVVRWQCLVGMYFCTGLRESELRNLKLQDIDFKHRVLTIRETKFRKSRLVPVHPSVIKAMQTYLPLRKRQESDVVFQTFRGDPLHPSTLNQTFNKVVRRLKIGGKDWKKPRIHDFRHSFAVNKVVEWQNSGADVQKMLEILSTYLGHSHYEDTAYYLESSENILKAALWKFKAPEERRGE